VLYATDCRVVVPNIVASLKLTPPAILALVTLPSAGIILDTCSVFVGDTITAFDPLGNGASENLSIGSGQGGAGNGLEFVAFASYAGLLTEQELGILARRFYETHL